MVADSSLDCHQDDYRQDDYHQDHLEFGGSKSEHGGHGYGVPSYSIRGATRNNSQRSTDSSLSGGSFHGCSTRSNTSNASMRSLSSNQSLLGDNRRFAQQSSDHNKRSAPRRHHSMGILSHTSNNTNNPFQTKSFRKPTLNRSTSGNYDPLGGVSNHSTRSIASGFQHSYKKPLMPSKQQYLAMDCEMVGTVTGKSVAARVVLIDWKGRPIFDKHTKPDEKVADYRTFVSGITEDDLKDAAPFIEVVQEVRDMLKDKILVGHGLDNDLRALGIDHPWLMMRDTAYYQPFMRQLETSTFNIHIPHMDGQPIWGPRKLKELAKEKLQRDIQVPGKSHCPIEDAAAALDLYKSHRPRWEACMSTEERQQKQRQAYEVAVLAYEQYHAQLAFLGSNHPQTCSQSSKDLSASVHSYFLPDASQPVNGASNQMNSTVALHTGFQYLAPPGISRESGSRLRLESHSYHGSDCSINFHSQQASSQLSAHTGLRLYERTTRLTPDQIQSQLSLGASPSNSMPHGPLLRRLSSSSSTGFLGSSPPNDCGSEDCFATYDVNEVVSPSY